MLGEDDIRMSKKANKERGEWNGDDNWEVPHFSFFRLCLLAFRCPFVASFMPRDMTPWALS